MRRMYFFADYAEAIALTAFLIAEGPSIMNVKEVMCHEAPRLKQAGAHRTLRH